MKKMLNFELIKFIKNRKIFWSFPIIGILSFILTYLIYLLSPDKKTSGFMLLSQMLSFIYSFFSFLIAVFGTLIFSSEYDYKTLPMLLIGRISRKKIIISKIIVIFFITFFILFSVFFFSILAGFIFSNFKSLEIQGYVIMNSLSLWKMVFLTFFLLSLPFFVYGVIGFLVGVILKHTLPSIFLTLSLVFFFTLFSLFPGIKNYVFSGYSQIPIEFMSKISKGINISYKWISNFLVFHLVYLFIFIFFSFLIFERREV